MIITKGMELEMLNEKKMMDLILTLASLRDDVRLVYMNGSRVNPMIKKDKYQDYDLVFGVTTTEYFLQHQDWIKLFGEVCMIQEPDYIDCKTGLKENADFSKSYTWLILYKDGNRIDLHIELVSESKKNIHNSSLTKILLDKDHCLDSIPPSSDIDYHIHKPSQELFDACSNEFWWCLNNVAKGLARNEIPYALSMFHVYVREVFHQMIDWHIGCQTNFSISSGKMGKFYKNFLSPSDYKKYLATYSDASIENIWTAVFTCCSLFSDYALQVSNQLNFRYNLNDENNMLEYLRKCRDDK
ncbi:aminoglycoside 6-adenylyltransferase [Anaerorhabdus furcosa]|uniref:Aminoglycoside 6-adenylyltransferase n=1 Tax=Anaerorhabdus furcosa TaxID=118967 RepID=A0A1T4KRE5_9FIRM|nr:aminoglycoside 6-adenylyltransferase [Anaerorhabdus furcosa]SJZ45001.1 aminoglycoside 6-adenylyltransferase [Anaerorhabdus furcosa]